MNLHCSKYHRLEFEFEPMHQESDAEAVGLRQVEPQPDQAALGCAQISYQPREEPASPVGRGNGPDVLKVQVIHLQGQKVYLGFAGFLFEISPKYFTSMRSSVETSCQDVIAGSGPFQMWFQ